MSSKLVIIRHGKSTWNKLNKFTGYSDVPLCDSGIEQSIICGTWIKTRIQKFDYAFLSDTIRTRDTLKYIEQNVTIDKKIYDNKLIERDYGRLTGNNKEEVEDMYGVENVYKWRHRFYDIPPQGESVATVTQRSGKYFDEVIYPHIQNNKNILMVSHGNTIRALFVHWGVYNDTNIELCKVPNSIPLLVDLKNKTIESLL